MVAHILKQPVLHAFDLQCLKIQTLKILFRRRIPLPSSGTQVERHIYTLWTECSLCMLQHMTCAVATTLNRIHLDIKLTLLSHSQTVQSHVPNEYSYKATLWNVYWTHTNLTADRSYTSHLTECEVRLLSCGRDAVKFGMLQTAFSVFWTVDNERTLLARASIWCDLMNKSPDILQSCTALIQCSTVPIASFCYSLR